LTPKTPKNDQNGSPPRLWLSIKNSNKLITFYRKTPKNNQSDSPRFEIVKSKCSDFLALK
jgi:hypothetical protein